MSHSNHWRAEVVGRLLACWRAAARAARLTIGIPDYDAYVLHLRQHHAGQRPMDRGEFFRDRMQARYGQGGTRCC